MASGQEAEVWPGGAYDRAVAVHQRKEGVGGQIALDGTEPVRATRVELVDRIELGRGDEQAARTLRDAENVAVQQLGLPQGEVTKLRLPLGPLVDLDEDAQGDGR
ncbi:MAG: hypothetical protein J0H99_22690, partial [Rhodospirillales bacterium]|nr:hypothetical protein [Rhodospirillales bacterium]